MSVGLEFHVMQVGPGRLCLSGIDDEQVCVCRAIYIDSSEDRGARGTGGSWMGRIAELCSVRFKRQSRRRLKIDDGNSIFVVHWFIC